MKFVLIFVIAYLVMRLVIPPLIKLAERYNFLDQPTERKKHGKATPLIGGLAMYISFIICFVIFIGLNDI